MSKSITTKQCRICNETKSTSMFYIHKSAKDGFAGICKVCFCNYMRLRYQKEEVKLSIKEYQNSEKYKTYREKYITTEHCKELQRINRNTPRRKEYDRKYRTTEKSKISLKKSYAKYASKNPEKRSAKNAILLEVLAKRLPKASGCICVKCNDNANAYHHHLGYEPEHWLDVIPLCRKCHIFTHISTK